MLGSPFLVPHGKLDGTAVSAPAVAAGRGLVAAAVTAAKRNSHPTASLAIKGKLTTGHADCFTKFGY